MRLGIKLTTVLFSIGVLGSTYTLAKELEPSVEEVSSFEEAYFTTTSSSMIPTNLSWPLDGKNIRHTSIFFDTDDAVEAVGKTCTGGRYPKHLGVDIHATPGSPVKSVYPGHVVRRGSAPGWGEYVVLSHDNNTWTSVYWHLENIQVVSDDTNGKHFNGDDVTTGEVLGYVFDTTPVGDVSHLHFGIRPSPYVWNSDIEGRRGIGKCAGKSNALYGFVNPYKHLSNNGYKLIDDTEATHTGSWVSSTNADLYTDKGYKALIKGTQGTAVYEYTTPSTGTYSIYTRFTPYSDRTTNATYKIYISGKLRKTVSIDQTNMNSRGENVYLVGYRVNKPNVKFKIEVSNGNGSDALISDAILFRKR